MTLNQFIDALGGTNSAATLFGVGPSAVSNWRAAGRLPDRLHLKALRVAEDRQLDFDPAPSSEMPQPSAA